MGSSLGNNRGYSSGGENGIHRLLSNWGIGKTGLHGCTDCGVGSALSHIGCCRGFSYVGLCLCRYAIQIVLYGLDRGCVLAAALLLGDIESDLRDLIDFGPIDRGGFGAVCAGYSVTSRGRENTDTGNNKDDEFHRFYFLSIAAAGAMALPPKYVARASATPLETAPTIAADAVPPAKVAVAGS